MVFGHIPFDENTRKNSGKRGSDQGERDPLSRLASPTDRVAAFIADLVLLVPFLTLVVAPFRRQALEAQLIENSEGWVYAYAMGLGASVLAFLAYQTIFLAWWGATPGKRAIGIKVETLWEKRGKPTALAALARSVAICLELVCLGLPWIAVFGNARRRPFHDRIGDTVVVAVRSNRAAGAPTLSEMSMSSGVIAASLFVFAFVVSIQLVRLKSSLDTEALVADLEESGGLCVAAGDAYRKWIPVNGEEKPTRVSVALTLFQAEEVDEACLRNEAEFALWNGKDKATGYLARGLSETEDPSIAEDYFKKVCETESMSDACHAVTLLDTPTVDTDDPVDLRTAEVEHENEVDRIAAGLDQTTAPYLRVLFVREYTERRQEERVLEMLNSLPPHRALAYYVSSRRAKALWNLDRKSEARVALRTSTEVADPAQRVDVARWFCDGETMEAGCSSEAKTACDLMGAVVDQSEIFLIEPETVASYLRGENCSDRLTAERLELLEKKIPDQEAKSYVKALVKLKDDDAQGAIELFKAIAMGDGKAGPFFIEANARLAELASSPQELAEVRDAWSQADPSQSGWGFLGRRLMERYNALKSYEQAVSVGMKMAEHDGIDRLAAKSMVVATHRSGRNMLTNSFLERLGEIPNLEVLIRDRRPASDPDSYDEVLLEILSKGHGKDRSQK